MTFRQRPRGSYPFKTLNGLFIFFCLGCECVGFYKIGQYYLEVTDGVGLPDDPGDHFSTTEGHEIDSMLPLQMEDFFINDDDSMGFSEKNVDPFQKNYLPEEESIETQEETPTVVDQVDEDLREIVISRAKLAMWVVLIMYFTYNALLTLAYTFMKIFLTVAPSTVAFLIRVTLPANALFLIMSLFTLYQVPGGGKFTLVFMEFILTITNSCLYCYYHGIGQWKPHDDFMRLVSPIYRQHEPARQYVIPLSPMPSKDGQGSTNEEAVMLRGRSRRSGLYDKEEFEGANQLNDFGDISQNQRGDSPPINNRVPIIVEAEVHPSTSKASSILVKKNGRKKSTASSKRRASVKFASLSKNTIFPPIDSDEYSSNNGIVDNKNTTHNDGENPSTDENDLSNEDASTDENNLSNDNENPNDVSINIENHLLEDHGPTTDKQVNKIIDDNGNPLIADNGNPVTENLENPILNERPNESNITKDSASKVSLRLSNNISIKVNQEAETKSNKDLIKLTPDVCIEVSPEVSTQITPDVSTQITPDVSTQITPDVCCQSTQTEVSTKVSSIVITSGSNQTSQSDAAQSEENPAIEGLNIPMTEESIPNPEDGFSG